VKVWKVYCRVPREKFCGCCRSTVLTGASCWPSSNCIPAQKIVYVSMEVNHNRSALVLTPAMVCAVTTLVYIRAVYTTSRGGNPIFEATSPHRLNACCQVWKIIYLQKISWFGRMEHVPKKITLHKMSDPRTVLQ